MTARKDTDMTTASILLACSVWLLAGFGLGCVLGPRLATCCLGQTMSREDAERLRDRLQQRIDARECCCDLPEDFDIEWLENQREDVA